VTATEQRAVAAFDFDGTLTRGGSVVPFLIAVRGRWPVVKALARNLPRLLRGGIAGGAAADDAKEALFTDLLAGIPVEEVDRRCVEFAARHLRRRLRYDARERLEWHKRRGDAVLVVSASPECYVAPAARLLGADDAVATHLAVNDGLLTGRYEGTNCRGEAKSAGVTAWIRSHGIATAQPVLWAYGNSRGDLRLLGAADHGVNAGRLGRLGRLGRFPRLADVLREVPSTEGAAGATR
jgi:phosphatidylglycerophosphatase C